VGTVQAVVDASTGEVVQRLEHDEFGRVLFDSNPGLQPFGFAGGLVDAETGLVRFGARDYEPIVGRWTARDPVRFAGGENVFSSSGGDPVNFTDGNGLFEMSPDRHGSGGGVTPVPRGSPGGGAGAGAAAGAGAGAAAGLWALCEAIFDYFSGPSEEGCKGPIRRGCTDLCTEEVLKPGVPDRGPQFQKCMQTCLEENGC